MTDDTELLRRFAEDRSEAAMVELVRRHLPVVLGAALRQVDGNPHLAEEVAQTVFIDLYKKAGRLSRHAVLTGWLYTSVRYAASKSLRAARRRTHHEQEAIAMNEYFAPAGAGIDWDRVQPVLDAAMHGLNDADRDAVLLRFFEGRPFAEIGRMLGASEDAARMRVDRALDKLRGQLAKQGIDSTAAALALALSSQAAAAVPAGLVTSITGSVLAAGTGGAVAGGILIGWSKVQLGLAAAVVATGALVWQEAGNAALRRERDALLGQEQVLARLRDENQRLGQIAAEQESYRKDRQELAGLRRAKADLERRLTEVWDASDVDEQPVALRQTGPAYPMLLRQAIAAEKQQLALTAVGAVADPQNSKIVWLRKPETIEAIPMVIHTVSNQPGEYVSVDEMLRLPAKGDAVVSFIVGVNGEVYDVQGGSATRPEFAREAVAAVRLWKFKPGLKDGKAVNIRRQATFVFSPPASFGSMSWF